MASCGGLGTVYVRPAEILQVGGSVTLAFLFCVTCEPSWEINHVPIDKPPWSVVNREPNDRFKCPGCSRAVAWRPRSELAADVRKQIRLARMGNGPHYLSGGLVLPLALI